MQTNFTPEQLRDPDIREADAILRKCVHCGFCTATCPTYVTGGNELDSPRGRIYLIKDMLENDRVQGPDVVKHLDRCLTCLACMTTCPSGVDYAHLVEHGRARAERENPRPWRERALRRLLAEVIPYPARMRAALRAAALARPVARLLPGRLKGMVEMAPKELPPPSPTARPRVFPAHGTRLRRVALLPVCAQAALSPEVDAATIRLLTRRGVEVVVAEGSGCCGGLVHHLGRSDLARGHATANLEAWWRETKDGGGEGLDAIVVNASGCGSVVKDYAHLFRNDPVLLEKANAIAALARDVSEVVAEVGLGEPAAPQGLRIAYQTACSLQHGQRIVALPKDLLRQAGFEVAEIAEPHLCCGSAGTYSLLQPATATTLRDRKIANIERTQPQAIASGNIGCITHLREGTILPVAHTIEFLDWATGGPEPPALAASSRP